MATARIPTAPRMLGDSNRHLMAWACVGLLAATIGVASARVLHRGVGAAPLRERLEVTVDALQSYSAMVHETVAVAASCSDELRVLAREQPARVIRAALMEEGMLTAPPSRDAASVALDRLLAAHAATLDALAGEMARLQGAGRGTVPAAAVLTAQAHGQMLRVCDARDVARGAVATLRR